MVTGDSFQRCHAALSSHQLIHSPPPSGSLAFVPFLFRPFNLKSAQHPGRKTSPYLAAARIIHPRDGSASRTQQFTGTHTRTQSCGYTYMHINTFEVMVCRELFTLCEINFSDFGGRATRLGFVDILFNPNQLNAHRKVGRCRGSWKEAQ